MKLNLTIVCAVILLASISYVGAQPSQGNSNKGAATLEDVPDWLRSYPGIAPPAITYSNKTDRSVYISFKFITPDDGDKVVAYYKQQLQGVGLDPTTEITQGYGRNETTVSSAIGKDPSVRISIKPKETQQTEVEVTYSHYAQQSYEARPPAAPVDKSVIAIIVAFVIVGLVSLLIWLWALIDCLMNEPGQGNEKVIWIVIILFLQLFGAILYLLIRRPKRKAQFGK